MNSKFIPEINEIEDNEGNSNLCLTGGNVNPEPCVTGGSLTNSCLTGTGSEKPNMCMSGSSEIIT